MTSLRLDGLDSLIRRLLRNPYLKAIRNGLTLTLPLVMAGSFALLVANFPWSGYQESMDRLFGGDWRLVMAHVADGTFSILAVVILLTISFSLAEHHNSKKGVSDMHPAIVALVSMACLVAVIQPYSLISPDMDLPPPGMGLPFFWLGIHGLFVSILVAFLSTFIFFLLRRVKFLNISYFTEDADASVPYAFSALLPGMITILFFALIKTILQELGVESVHQSIYNLVSGSFAKMGNTFSTAVFYTFIRHFFWFFGVHGTNLLEPVTTSLYVPALEENIAAVAAGTAPPHIFTKAFFDAFVALGGSGSTLCLLLAVLIANRRGSMRKITKISMLPAVFNINEMVMFGMPIVLNPVFLIPYLAVPVVQCVAAYLATSWGILPHTTSAMDWTAPLLVGGYTATGSIMGGAMQVINLVIGIIVYLPFVRLAEAIKREAFNNAFRELMPGYAESIGDADYVVTGEARALSRSLANDLSAAIRRGEIFLEYQPQVESVTGKVFGVEALMRWEHANLGRIPPNLFITLAEESNLIKPLGDWALEECCRQWNEWRNLGHGDVVMSVNLSVHQLDGEDILESIDSRVRRYAIPRGMLEVEVTESAALGGGVRSALLHKIHSLGVSLAIDDFGMGHSSLVYLKHFPVDTLKIDRVLSKDVVTSRHSSEIIFTIAELCKSLGIHPLVEFVENVEQLRALQNLGCTRIQGWLYSPSLPPEKCLEFIRRGAPIL